MKNINERESVSKKSKIYKYWPFKTAHSFLWPTETARKDSLYGQPAGTAYRDINREYDYKRS